MVFLDVVIIVDVLDIFYRLRIPDMTYCSGEKITEKGRERIRNIFEIKRQEARSFPDIFHWEDLSYSTTTNGFINQLLVKDLLEIQAYEATH